MLQSMLEFTCVRALIFPFVLAKAMWFAKLILASVNVTHSKDIATLSVLETVFPLTLVSVSVFPLVHTVAICL
jgi:hypothetical protein